MIDPRDLTGCRLDGVTVARLHHPDGTPSLLHAWFHVEGAGPVRLHTPGHDVALQLDPPYGSYAMDEYGHVVVEAAPPEFAPSRFIGERIAEVEPVPEPAIGASIGFVLHFAAAGSLRVRNICDELVFDVPRAGPQQSGPDSRTAAAHPRIRG